METAHSHSDIANPKNEGIIPAISILIMKKSLFLPTSNFFL